MADDENVDKKSEPVITPDMSVVPTSEQKIMTNISTLASGGAQVSSATTGVTSFQLHQHFIPTPLGIRLANSAVAMPVQNLSSQVGNPELKKTTITGANYMIWIYVFF